MSKGQFLSRGKLGALTLASAAALMLVLAGCQGPTGPLQHIQEARTGTVTLSFSPGIVGFAIMPDFDDWHDQLGDADYVRVVFTRTNGVGIDDSGLIPADGFDATFVRTLAHGDWSVVVTAYSGDSSADPFDGVLIAQSLPVPFTLSDAAYTVRDIILAPVGVHDTGYGDFDWNLTVPSGPAFEDAEVNIVFNPAVPGSFYGLIGSEEVPAGPYTVTITVTLADYRFATLVEYLRVFSSWTSEFEWDFFEDDFEAPPVVTPPTCTGDPETCEVVDCTDC